METVTRGEFQALVDRVKALEQGMNASSSSIVDVDKYNMRKAQFKNNLMSYIRAACLEDKSRSSIKLMTVSRPYNGQAVKYGGITAVLQELEDQGLIKVCMHRTGYRYVVHNELFDTLVNPPKTAEEIAALVKDATG